MFKFKKLILSIFTLGLTVVTLTTSTYAWFARNNEAWTEEFDLNIQSLDTLLVSVDGEHYYSNLSSDLIKKAVVSKLVDTPVTELDDDELVNEEYSKVKLETVTTNSSGSLNRFYSVDPNEYDDEGYYVLQEASKYSYFSFDLHFRIVTTGDANKRYNLSFNNVDDPTNQSLKTKFTAGNSNVTLWNSLVAIDRLYVPNEVITTNAANAMRLGVSSSSNSSMIFEPQDTDTFSYDRGSYPIEGDTEARYNPASNAMLTYSNNINKYKLRPIAGSTLKDTYKSFGATPLGTFNAGTTYQDIELSFYIWLEGYDADYIPGMDTSSISSFLSFRIDEVVA